MKLPERKLAVKVLDRRIFIPSYYESQNAMPYNDVQYVLDVCRND